MPTARVIDALQVLVRPPDEGTDGELLQRFRTLADEAAFAELVRRHGPMVYGVIRRILLNGSDVDDAFQATFFVLARKADSIRGAVAPWLHGVAVKVANKARVQAVQRRVRQMAAARPEAVHTPTPVADLWLVLDEELAKLPDELRQVVIICDVNGQSRSQAAKELGWPEGTVAKRLVKARELLAKQLTRRGITLSVGALAVALAEGATAAVPNAVVSSTIKVVTLLAANQAVGAISGSVTALTEGVLKTMLLKKIMATTMIVLALGMAVITGESVVIGQTEGTGKPMNTPPIAVAKPKDKPPMAVVAPRDVVVNTPTILGKLQGEWELQPTAEGEYKQRLIFTSSSSGNWQRSKETLPVNVTYYVVGHELLIQYYHEPNGAFNYRLEQLRFEYKLNKDLLTLMAGDTTQTWKRILKANQKPEPEKLPPAKEARIPDPMLPPFEFHREGATNPEDAAKAFFRSCALTSIKDFVQHLNLPVCEGPIGTLQKFAECLHTTKFKTGEESYAVYDLPVGKNGGLKHDTIRVVASGEFPADEKVVAVISHGAASSYYGEKFLAVDVAADGSDDRVYQTRVVVAVIKDRWYVVPRCRSSKPFYEIADAMLIAKPAAKPAK